MLMGIFRAVLAIMSNSDPLFPPIEFPRLQYPKKVSMPKTALGHYGV